MNFPEFQEILVSLPADPSVEDRKWDDGGDTVVGPPDEKSGVSFSDVELLHHSVSHLVPDYYEDWDEEDLHMTLQAREGSDIFW